MKLLSVASALAAFSSAAEYTLSEARKARDVQLSINEDLCIF